MQQVKKSVTILRPPNELYAYWRNLENLPRFMYHLQMVEDLGGNRSHWTARGPADRDVEWDAEIVEDRPNELISWRSIEGQDDVRNAGSVRFIPAPGDRGTEVHVTLGYEPPLGKVGALFAKLFGEEPGQQVGDDLHRFKQIMETGEVLRSDGSPVGRGERGILRQHAAQPAEPEARA